MTILPGNWLFTLVERRVPMKTDMTLARSRKKNSNQGQDLLSP